ncbi:MAG: peptide chain release factor 2 [Armatimonadota bacterium]
MLSDVKRELEALSAKYSDLRGHLDLAKKQEEAAILEQKVADPYFWDNPDEAQKVLRDLSQIKSNLDPWLKLDSKIEDMQVLADLAAEESDNDSYVEEIQGELKEATSMLQELELTTLLSGDHDQSNAIVEINSGAGGTESCDWVEILLRMYLRWAERKGYQTEILDTVAGEIAGMKNVTFVVRGMNAYGYLRSERGVHRLVRISPFDANKRRHTSFASVDIIPEVTETESIEINPDDIRIDTYRASSAGGQHVNKTDSAVRITHIPTGLVVSCQNERSQHQNREVAMMVLKARLLERERQEKEQKLSELRGEQRSIEWGNQIRSYVFQPYTLVKDHRTNTETGNVIAVMDGEIDIFIQAYLKWSMSRSD